MKETWDLTHGMYTAENQVLADTSPELSNYILNMFHYHFPVTK